MYVLCNIKKIYLTILLSRFLVKRNRFSSPHLTRLLSHYTHIVNINLQSVCKKVLVNKSTVLCNDHCVVVAIRGLDI